MRNSRKKRNGSTWSSLGQGRISPLTSPNQIGQYAQLTSWELSEVALTLDCSLHRVFDLKVALRELTTVPEERQKILGLVKGKLPPDQERMYVPRFIV